MNNGGARRVIPVVLVLIVIAVAIAALVSVGQSIFNGGSSNTPAVNQGKVSLIDTAEDRSVRMTIRGQIKADETFNSYVVTASATSRTMTTYSGYLDRQIETKQLVNNIPAYEQFVYALNRYGMMDANELTGDANDTRGVCAGGHLYQFDTLRGSNVIKSLWTTDCKANLGSLRVSSALLQNLFLQQIPDYSKMLNKIKL